MFDKLSFVQTFQLQEKQTCMDHHLPACSPVCQKNLHAPYKLALLNYHRSHLFLPLLAQKSNVKEHERNINKCYLVSVGMFEMERKKKRIKKPPTFAFGLSKIIESQWRSCGMHTPSHLLILSPFPIPIFFLSL